ncbi:MAG: DUF885 domain-containing protein [Pseudomonadota bacterium]
MGAETGSNALDALLHDVWQDRLTRSTTLRVQHGQPIERFEQFTLAHHRETLAARDDFRARLAAIRKSQLSPDELLSYSILEFELADDGTNDDDFWLTFDLTAYQAPYSLRFAETYLRGFTFESLSDNEEYCRLLASYSESLRQLAEKVAMQAERGIYLSAAAHGPTRQIWLDRREMVDAALRVDYSRIAHMPEREKALFIDRTNQIVDAVVLVAFDQILAQLNEQYLSNSPETVGLMHYPNGRAVYDRQVRRHTSLLMTAEEIHLLGLRQVSELAHAMNELRDEMGVDVPKDAFHEQLRQDPRYIAKNPGEVARRYEHFMDLVEPRLNEFFRLMPKAPFGIKQVDASAEAGLTFGYYSPPSPTQPSGYYLFNGSQLDQRSMIGAAALIVHELLPGHHFHLALQQEDPDLPMFRRYYMPTAYMEGWAEYAGFLGHELGVYDDPMDRYGRYLSESFLAVRLVVDTGMNAMGWTLEEARSYMLDNSFMSELEVASESLRYATSLPGQALAYRIGSQTMIDLRKEAEVRLGEEFDIRDFHDVVLESGSIPLTVLEERIDEYIDQKPSSLR